jgi:hypothetical protein
MGRFHLHLGYILLIFLFPFLESIFSEVTICSPLPPSFAAFLLTKILETKYDNNYTKTNHKGRGNDVKEWTLVPP